MYLSRFIALIGFRLGTRNFCDWVTRRWTFRVRSGKTLTPHQRGLITHDAILGLTDQPPSAFDHILDLAGLIVMVFVAIPLLILILCIKAIRIGGQWLYTVVRTKSPRA